MSSERTVLSEQNAVATLIFILKEGGFTKASYVQQVVPNYSSVKSIASKLEKKNLITITDISGKNGYIEYRLTPLGTIIAKDLKRADDHLKNIFDSYQPTALVESDTDNVFDVSDYLAGYNGNKILEHIENNPGICINELEAIFGADSVRNRIIEAEKLGLIKHLTPSNENVPCFFITDEGREVMTGLRYAQRKEGDIEPNCQANLEGTKNRVS